MIYPNNDSGNEIILKEYMKLKKYSKIKLLPSMRFEYYLTLLKHAKFLIGNSSSGIMEAPYYGTPAINILKTNKVWKISNQKEFQDIKYF